MLLIVSNLLVLLCCVASVAVIIRGHISRRLLLRRLDTCDLELVEERRTRHLLENARANDLRGYTQRISSIYETASQHRGKCDEAVELCAKYDRERKKAEQAVGEAKEEMRRMRSKMRAHNCDHDNITRCYEQAAASILGDMKYAETIDLIRQGPGTDSPKMVFAIPPKAMLVRYDPHRPCDLPDLQTEEVHLSRYDISVRVFVPKKLNERYPNPALVRAALLCYGARLFADVVMSEAEIANMEPLLWGK